MRFTVKVIECPIYPENILCKITNILDVKYKIYSFPCKILFTVPLKIFQFILQVAYLFALFTKCLLYLGEYLPKSFKANRQYFIVTLLENW